MTETDSRSYIELNSDFDTVRCGCCHKEITFGYFYRDGPDSSCIQLVCLNCKHNQNH